MSDAPSGTAAMDPSAWRDIADVCGGCIAWRSEDPRPGDDVASGVCRLRAELGRVPASLGRCPLYKPRGQYVYTPEQPRRSPKRRRAEKARVLRRDAAGELVAEAPSLRRGSPTYNPPTPRPAPPREVDVGELEPAQFSRLLREVFAEPRSRPRAIHPRFEGGKLRLRAGEREAEVELERFFLMLDGLKTDLEQLEDQVSGTEALLPQFSELIGYLRKAQASLTTFNFLFERRDDYFSGKL